MIDLNVIEAQCKSSIANGYGHLPVIDCGNAVKVMELITRLRQAEKDAARYLWLRDQADGFQLRDCMKLKGEDWNHSIDRVMSVKYEGEAGDD